MMRLDKYLSQLGLGTRSQLKAEIKKGAVTIDGRIVTKAETKLDPKLAVVCYHGRELSYQAFEYYMFHKPAGCVSATQDREHPTVLSYLSSGRRDLFPVGRLDLDTEGLLLITNDGELAHRLLAPARHIPKTYFARIEGRVDEEDIRLFREGMDIGEKRLTLPAELVVQKAGEVSEVELTIYEGKYHQVKRMFAHVHKPVLYLKRVAMGSLRLDESLKPGEYRSLTNEELSYLKSE